MHRNVFYKTMSKKLLWISFIPRSLIFLGGTLTKKKTSAQLTRKWYEKRCNHPQQTNACTSSSQVSNKFAQIFASEISYGSGWGTNGKPTMNLWFILQDRQSLRRNAGTTFNRKHSIKYYEAVFFTRPRLQNVLAQKSMSWKPNITRKLCVKLKKGMRAWCWK